MKNSSWQEEGSLQNCWCCKELFIKSDMKLYHSFLNKISTSYVLFGVQWLRDKRKSLRDRYSWLPCQSLAKILVFFVFFLSITNLIRLKESTEKCWLTGFAREKTNSSTELEKKRNNSTSHFQLRQVQSVPFVCMSVFTVCTSARVCAMQMSPLHFLPVFMSLGPQNRGQIYNQGCQVSGTFPTTFHNPAQKSSLGKKQNNCSSCSSCSSCSQCLCGNLASHGGNEFLICSVCGMTFWHHLQ